VARVRRQLAPAEQSHFMAAPSLDPRAHEAYLRGMLLLDRIDESNYRKALAHFQEASTVDPTYGEAWAGLAACYYYMSSLFIPADEAMPKARAAAERALSLDPEIGSAHATLAMVTSMYDWHWTEGDRHFRRALELSPGDASVHWLYSYVLAIHRRFDEAVDHVRMAKSLDPLSQFAVAGEIWTLYLAGRYAEGLKVGYDGLARDSSYATIWLNVEMCHEELGQLDDALRCARRAANLTNQPWARMSVGFALARAGRRQEAREVFSRALAGGGGNILHCYRARIHLALGEENEAMDQLEAGLAQHEEDLATLRVDPRFRALRGTPRYEALATRLGL